MSLEVLEIDQGAFCCGRRISQSHESQRRQHGTKDDKTYYTDCPTEANLRFKLVQDHRVYDSA